MERRNFPFGRSLCARAARPWSSWRRRERANTARKMSPLSNHSSVFEAINHSYYRNLLNKLSCIPHYGPFRENKNSDIASWLWYDYMPALNQLLLVPLYRVRGSDYFLKVIPRCLFLDTWFVNKKGLKRKSRSWQNKTSYTGSINKRYLLPY